MLEKLKAQVYKGNMDLVKHGLVISTWGNVSAYDPDSKLVVIKPSGVNYDEMKEEDMVVVDLDGIVVEGNLKPSSDTATHLEIYKNFEGVNSVVHTHSKWATVFAQSKRSVIPYGTTHADYFSQEVPVTRPLTKIEISKNYEKNTGLVIIETFERLNIDYLHCPSVLVNEHGPFSWGITVEEAVHHALVLETISEMAFYTETITKEQKKMDQDLQNKHFSRKHGKDKYYGQ